MRVAGLLVEAGTQFPEQEYEVGAVFGAGLVARAGHAGVLPVDIEAVEIVLLEEGQGAIDELATRDRGEGGVREAAGAEPATDGDHQLEAGLGCFEGA